MDSPGAGDPAADTQQPPSSKRTGKPSQKAEEKNAAESSKPRAERPRVFPKSGVVNDVEIEPFTISHRYTLRTWTPTTKTSAFKMPTSGKPSEKLCCDQGFPLYTIYDTPEEDIPRNVVLNDYHVYLIFEAGLIFGESADRLCQGEGCPRFTRKARSRSEVLTS